MYVFVNQPALYLFTLYTLNSGVEVCTRHIKVGPGGERVKVQIWDSAGQERSRSIIQAVRGTKVGTTCAIGILLNHLVLCPHKGYIKHVQSWCINTEANNCLITMATCTAYTLGSDSRVFCNRGEVV